MSADPKRAKMPIGVLMELAYLCKRDSQVATAKRLGFSSAFINDVLHGRRGITDALADKLGYERVTRFIPKQKGQP